MTQLRMIVVEAGCRMDTLGQLLSWREVFADDDVKAVSQLGWFHFLMPFDRLV